MTHDFGTFVFRNLYHDFVPSSGKVSIGNNVYIGRDVTILKGVNIGDNCIIGLGSIVTKDIPSNSVKRYSFKFCCLWCSCKGRLWYRGILYKAPREVNKGKHRILQNIIKIFG